MLLLFAWEAKKVRHQSLGFWVQPTLFAFFWRRVLFSSILLLRSFTLSIQQKNYRTRSNNLRPQSFSKNRDLNRKRKCQSPRQLTLKRQSLTRRTQKRKLVVNAVSCSNKVKRPKIRAQTNLFLMCPQNLRSHQSPNSAPSRKKRTKVAHCSYFPNETLSASQSHAS